MADLLTTHGWNAVPCDPSLIFSGKHGMREPEPAKVNDVPLPQTSLAEKVLEYAKKELREETFNHSMRVYYYGTVNLPSQNLRGVLIEAVNTYHQ